MKHCISGSNGISLQFPDSELYKEYQKNLELLEIQTYKAIRDKYGIWAANQNTFVKSREDLKEFDSSYMETLYDKYYDTE